MRNHVAHPTDNVLTSAGSACWRSSLTMAGTQGELQQKEQQLDKLAAENRRCAGDFSGVGKRNAWQAALLAASLTQIALVTCCFWSLRLRERVQLLEHNIGRLGEDVRCAPTSLNAGLRKPKASLVENTKADIHQA